MIHCSALKSEYSTAIGNNVQVRPGAIVHGATVEDNCIIGEGAQVMDGSRIGRNTRLLPGAIVSTNKTIPGNEIWGGCPAKLVRRLSDVEIAAAEESNEMHSVALVHAAETSKSWQEVLLDEEDLYQTEHRQPYYYARKTRQEHEKAFQAPDISNYPGRIFSSPGMFTIYMHVYEMLMFVVYSVWKQLETI